MTRATPTAPMNCPRCRTALALANDRHTCAACEGSWFTPPAFQGALHRPGSAPDRAASADVLGDGARPVTYLPCPACAVLMRRFNFGSGSGVIVDACRQHGVWVDHGELGALRAFINGSRIRRVKAISQLRRREPEGGATGLEGRAVERWSHRVGFVFELAIDLLFFWH